MVRSRFHRHVVATSLAFAGGLFVSCVASCVDDGGDAPPPSRPSSDAGQGPFDREGAVRLPRAPSSPENAGAMDIGGTVVNDDGERIVGRPLVVVDAKGRRFEAMTDEGGGFWVMGAEPPYDLALDPAPSGHSPVPFAVFGVTRSDPTFEVSEHFDDAPVQSLHVALELPPALASSTSVWASAASRSASGAGRVTVVGGARPDPSRLSLALDHVFRLDEPPDGETIDLHVLVGDASETFAYVHHASIPAAPGAVTELGILEAAATPALGPVAVSVVDPGQASWSSAVRLEVRGARLELPWRGGSTVRWPDVPGSLVQWRAADATEEAPLPRREVWSDVAATLPPSTTLTASGELAFTLPPEGAPLSRGASGMRWQGSSGIFEITLTDDGGRRLFRALTADPELDFARLERLGIARPDVGSYACEMTHIRSRNIDAWLESDPDARLAALRKAGASLRLHRPLDVIP